MASEETYWIPWIGEGKRELGYSGKKWFFENTDQKWLLGKNMQDAEGSDVKSLFESVSTQMEVMEKALWVTSELVRVKGGTFQMGNTRNDPEGVACESPVHQVRLAYDFWVGRYPVVLGEYDTYCMEKNIEPLEYNGPGRGFRPATVVSWFDAIQFCNWLSEREGIPKAYGSKRNLRYKSGKGTQDITEVRGYRLLTEAEWEYAARGGHRATRDWKYAGSDELGEVGWYDENSNKKLHPVGKKKANELGLYGMSGNVWEWCHDWWRWDGYPREEQTNPLGPAAGSFRVTRGGSWKSYYRGCRISARNGIPPENGFGYLGFRVARTC